MWCAWWTVTYFLVRGWHGKGGEWQEMGLKSSLGARLWRPWMPPCLHYIPNILSFLLMKLQYLPLTSMMQRKWSRAHIQGSFWSVPSLYFHPQYPYTLHPHQPGLYSLPIIKFILILSFPTASCIGGYPLPFCCFYLYEPLTSECLRAMVLNPQQHIRTRSFYKNISILVLPQTNKIQSVECGARVTVCFKSFQAVFIVQSGMRTTALQSTHQFLSWLAL